MLEEFVLDTLINGSIYTIFRKVILINEVIIDDISMGLWPGIKHLVLTNLMLWVISISMNPCILFNPDNHVIYCFILKFN